MHLNALHQPYQHLYEIHCVNHLHIWTKCTAWTTELIGLNVLYKQLSFWRKFRNLMYYVNYVATFILTFTAWTTEQFGRNVNCVNNLTIWTKWVNHQTIFRPKCAVWITKLFGREVLREPLNYLDQIYCVNHWTIWTKCTSCNTELFRPSILCQPLNYLDKMNCLNHCTARSNNVFGLDKMP